MSLQDQYNELVEKRIKSAQESGDIPAEFIYEQGGKTWVCLLPKSVMAQKKILNMFFLMGEDKTGSIESDFMREISKYVKVGGQPISIEDISIGDWEVLKMAYTDGLLLPLYHGSQQAVDKFVEKTIGSLL